MSLLDLRTTIVDTLKTELEDVGVRTCQAHGGRFDVTELRRWALQGPAVLVACLGMPSIRRQGRVNGEVRFAAFVITGGTSEVKRDASALIIVEKLVRLIGENTWKHRDASTPHDVDADNLYAGTIDNLGVALWATSWRQWVDLDEFDPSTLDDFNEMFTDYDMAPADGVIDMEGYVQLQGVFMSAYGQLIISSAVATNIASPDTYQKAAMSSSLSNYSDCDSPVTGRLRHTGTVTRTFLVSAALSVEVSADAKVTLALARNGVVDETTAIEQDITAAGGAEAFSLKDIVDLSQNQYIEVWVKADSTVNVTLTKMSLTAAAA